MSHCDATPLVVGLSNKRLCHHLKDGDERPEQTVEILALTDVSDGRCIRYFLAKLTTEQIHTENTADTHTHTYKQSITSQSTCFSGKGA